METLVETRLVLLVLAFTALLPGLATAVDLSEERMREVTRLLSEGPTAFGRPISDRAAWQELAARPDAHRVVQQAERLAARPLPEQPDELYLDFSRTGNRTRWQRVASRRRGRVAALVKAECLENQGRFLPALQETVRALCSERTWVMPAHDRGLHNFRGETTDIDLASSALAWELATARALLGDRLSPEVRKLIEQNVHRRVLGPFVEMVSGKRKENWWLGCTNNWNAVCLAGLTGAALALVPSRQERARFVVAAEQYSRNYLNGFTPDGYCSEGVGYWNYGFGHYVLLAEAIYQATGGEVDLMARRGVREPALYGARIEIADGICPAFADCAVGTGPSPRILWYVGGKLGLDVGGGRPQGLSAGGALPEALMYAFPNSASVGRAGGEPPLRTQLRTWFPDAGVFIGRPQSGSACRLAVALKGGHNAEHHNHNDVGSYVVVVGEQAVLVDPGAEVYTARTFGSRRYESKVLNSYGHPVPVVDGALQRTGRDARAEADIRFSAERDVVALDLAPAYQVEGLRKLERTLTYCREGRGSLTVTDEVTFDRPAVFATALVTFGRWEKVDETTILVYDTEEAVRVTVDTDGLPFSVRPERIEEDVRADHPPLRLGIELARPVREAAIRLRIAPSGREGPPLRNRSFED